MTAPTLEDFIQGVVLYPNVQNRARDESDRVCQESLPNIEDEPVLPCMRATVKEI